MHFNPTDIALVNSNSRPQQRGSKSKMLGSKNSIPETSNNDMLAMQTNNLMDESNINADHHHTVGSNIQQKKAK
jgi:hypothetical protein